jgi:uncharacterized protein YdaU (DUF1376 family)
MNSRTFAELEKQLERMKEEISAMKKGQKKKSPPAQNAKSKSKSTGRKTSTGNAVPSKKSRKKDCHIRLAGPEDRVVRTYQSASAQQDALCSYHDQGNDA